MRIPRGPQPTKISLTENQRAALQEIVRGRLTPQSEALRARIILEADSGARNAHIADNLHIQRQTVRLWRNRWADKAEIIEQIEAKEDSKKLCASIREVLADDSRSGCPPKFTADLICRIVALACTSPADFDRPISHWTARELADEPTKRKIVERISLRSVARFFGSGRPQTPQVSILAHQRKTERS